jgi:hypothetical protein
MAAIVIPVRPTDSQNQSDELTLPGLNGPIQYLPLRTTRFKHAIADLVNHKPLTTREIRMLDFVDQITEKPGWTSKVFDDTIIAKWKEEAKQPCADSTFEDVVLSETMFENVSG